MAEKNKRLLKKSLTERGWRTASDSGALVMQKGRVTLVLYSKDGFSEPKQSGIGTELCGYKPVIHSDDFQWYVESDGFLVATGSVKRAVKDAYDFSLEGPTGEAARELLEIIDKYGEMSASELLCLKQREVMSVAQEDDGAKAVPSSAGIGSTRKFVVDLTKNQKLSKFFAPDRVYSIENITNGIVSVGLMDRKLEGIEQQFNVPLSFLGECENRGYIMAAEIQQSSVKKAQFSYVPIASSSTGDLDESFNDLALSAGQKAIVMEAIGNGVNFTPLLDNGLSVAQLSEISSLLQDGADGSMLLGKSLTVEHLKFLDSLVKNHLPIIGFVDEDVSVEWLQRHYSEVSEAADVRLQELEGIPQFAKEAARRLIFEKKSYEECLKPVDSKSILELKLMKGGRFGDLAELLLEKGVEDNSIVQLSWISLTEEQKSCVLSYFKSPGLVVAGRDFNQFLEEQRENFLTVTWVQKSFRLRYKDIYFETDYNSVLARDSMSNVLWRSVYVNEKYYTYCDPQFNTLL